MLIRINGSNDTDRLSLSKEQIQKLSDKKTAELLLNIRFIQECVNFFYTEIDGMERRSYMIESYTNPLIKKIQSMSFEDLDILGFDYFKSVFDIKDDWVRGSGCFDRILLALQLKGFGPFNIIQKNIDNDKFDICLENK